MKINIFVEDMFFLKYIGCSTAAKTIFKELSRIPGMEISWNSRSSDFDLVHYHSFGPLSLLNRQYSRGIKVLTAHSTPRLNEGNLAFSKYINYYYPYAHRKFDHIIALTAQCKEEIENMVPNISTTLIPNGVDRDFFKKDEKKRQSFRDKFNIKSDRKVVLTVAQQTPRKGIYDFIELSKMNPRIHWVWVGGFPYGIFSKDYLKIEFIKRNCGENVTFTGFIPDIIEAYSGADVFFMPSYAENFILVILEALSCGLPVVARGIPEFREIFGNDVQFFNTKEEALRLLADDESLRQRSYGARTFSEKYDIKHLAQMHFDLYRRLIES